MGRLPALLAIMLAFVNAPLAAQTPPLDPQVPPALVRTASLDDRVTIPISIDGKGPWPFVIDTGSQRTVIARDLAQRLALPPRAVVLCGGWFAYSASWSRRAISSSLVVSSEPMG